MKTPNSLIAAALTLFVSTATIAENSNNLQSEDQPTILMGMSTALSGPAAKLGMNMKTGVEIAFLEANNSSPQSKPINLIALDDGYEPSRTAPNMHALINDHQVTAIIGNVGTPTAIAAIPIANQSKTVLFGAYTGAGALRKSPPDRYIINYRASYAQETAAMVDALITQAGLNINEIAFFTQRDAYGDAGYYGGVEALKAHGLDDESTITHGRYERNTIAVENGLADIMMADTPVKAVIMVGAYAPCAEFIKLAKEYELDAHFLNVSFVGSQPLANELGETGNGVIITQVVPHFDSNLPIAQQYRKALKRYAPETTPSFGSFEGYIAGRITLTAMQNIPAQPTRENMVSAYESLGDFDIGLQIPLNLSSTNHQASSMIWPTIIQDGQVVEFAWDQLNTSEKDALTDATVQD